MGARFFFGVAWKWIFFETFYPYHFQIHGEQLRLQLILNISLQWSRPWNPWQNSQRFCMFMRNGKKWSSKVAKHGNFETRICNHERFCFFCAFVSMFSIFEVDLFILIHAQNILQKKSLKNHTLRKCALELRWLSGLMARQYRRGDGEDHRVCSHSIAEWWLRMGTLWHFGRCSGNVPLQSGKPMQTSSSSRHLACASKIVDSHVCLVFGGPCQTGTLCQIAHS